MVNLFLVRWLLASMYSWKIRLPWWMTATSNSSYKETYATMIIQIKIQAQKIRRVVFFLLFKQPLKHPLPRPSLYQSFSLSGFCSRLCSIDDHNGMAGALQEFGRSPQGQEENRDLAEELSKGTERLGDHKARKKIGKRQKRELTQLCRRSTLEMRSAVTRTCRNRKNIHTG